MKVADLTGIALDWATCKAAGLLDAYPEYGSPIRFRKAWYYPKPFVHPSTNWEQGGPIIEREDIGYLPAGVHDGDQCEAFIYYRTQHDLSLEDGMSHRSFGPTLLIAAMRCYVASNLGDEVDVPQQLMEIKA